MRIERLAAKLPWISPRLSLTRTSAPPSDPRASLAAPECNKPAAPLRQALSPQQRRILGPWNSRRKEDSKGTELIRMPQSNQALPQMLQAAFLGVPPIAACRPGVLPATSVCQSHACAGPPYRKSRRTGQPPSESSPAPRKSPEEKY